MKTHRFDGPQKVKFVLPLDEEEQRFKAAADLLEQLRKPPAPMAQAKRR
jgi:hypothetical protein